MILMIMRFHFFLKRNSPPWTTWLATIAGTIALGITGAPAHAILPGLSLTGGQSLFSNDSWTLGWQFNTTRALNIDALGIFDAGVPGLNGTYQLGLWDASRALLTTTSVSGSGDVIANGFVWKSLSNLLTLSPGDYVVAAAGDYLTNGDDYAFRGSFSTLQGITFVRDRFIQGVILTYPLNSNGVTPAAFGGNFSEVPGPLPVLGAAAAFGWSRRLRRRLSSSATLQD